MPDGLRCLSYLAVRSGDSFEFCAIGAGVLSLLGLPRREGVQTVGSARLEASKLRVALPILMAEG
jgi:hypothetical protein